MIINPYAFGAAVNPVFTGLTNSYNFSTNANDGKGTINGTLTNGASIGAGGLNGGNALILDGGNDYVSFPANSFPLTGDFSIEGFAILDNTPGRTNTLIANTYYNGSKYVGFQIQYDTANSFYMYIGNGTNPDDIISYTTSLWGTTFHYAVTFVTATKQAKIYINNVLRATKTLSIAPTYNSSCNSIIGALDIYGTPTKYDYFKGKMNYVRVYNGTILTAGDVTTLYNSGNGLSYP